MAMFAFGALGGIVPDGLRLLAWARNQNADRGPLPLNDIAFYISMVLGADESLELIEVNDGDQAIAAVEGIDVLLIGTSDLTATMGIPGQLTHERVEQAYSATIAAARRHGKHVGMGGIYDPQLMPKYIDMGVRLILAGSDLAFLMAAAKERITLLRGLQRS